MFLEILEHCLFTQTRKKNGGFHFCLILYSFDAPTALESQNITINKPEKHLEILGKYRLKNNAGSHPHPPSGENTPKKACSHKIVCSETGISAHSTVNPTRRNALFALVLTRERFKYNLKLIDNFASGKTLINTNNCHKGASLQIK